MIVKLIIQFMSLLTSGLQIFYAIELRKLGNNGIFDEAYEDQAKAILSLVRVVIAVSYAQFLDSLVGGIYIWWLTNLNPESFKNN